MNVVKNYWLVVDRIRIPDAVDVINNHMKIYHAELLFSGTMYDYMLEQSPLLINLGHDRQVLESWKRLESFDSSSIIFEIDSNVDENKIIEHLQSLLQVRIEKSPFLLRYYTSNFWLKFSHQLNEMDINTLLGEANAIYWIDQDSQLNMLSSTIRCSDTESISYSLTSTVFKQ
ncbi:DUF4123 domain-containing protein [Vibrio fluvialis]|uniref:DUF4123 domain-containing protein n=1 Tax=Vibrio fluvialis TaxID=676 RepID=UPI00215CD7AE|nr:DUF4123 domain-containing protein [Vibrio fluvialis]EKO3962681.1 DUF4123 domain-containing protein [Vibrio fluvialis]MCR9297579.1 DUF4123 domain-containing protein [Vibrio fluvialis]